MKKEMSMYLDDIRAKNSTEGTLLESIIDQQKINISMQTQDDYH